MDFNLKTYNSLLNSILSNKFIIQTFCEFIENPNEKCVILRHDVDRIFANSLTTAKIEHELGITGSYYFRIGPESFNEIVIEQIAELGHEIGYHYEDVGSTAQRFKGITDEKELIDRSIERFKNNLEKLRKVVPVKTICMHGSPMSRWDSKLLWKYYNYSDYGIIGEPYFDIDFNQVFYITDTGRMWDGNKVSIRDKPRQKITTQWPTYHSTFDILKALNEGTFPGRAMMTIHPQRWTNNSVPWVKELLMQQLKNQVKRFLVK